MWVDPLGGRIEHQAGLEVATMSTLCLFDPECALMALPCLIFAGSLHQQDMVCILLEVATVAEIRDDGPFVSSLLTRSIQLGEAYDGDVEFLFQTGQTVADRLQCGVCVLTSRGSDEADIVDDYEL